MPEKIPTVSVIVPNYNYARYLEHRIESILEQTFKDFELILLDDASTDESLSVFEKYRSEPRVSQVIVNERNTGSPFQQWMKGIKAARGKWIWVAEADDLSSPGFLSSCLSRLEENPRAVACLTGSYYIDSQGHQLSGHANYWDSIKGYETAGCRCFKGHFYAAHKLYWSCCILNTSATVFSREAAMRLSQSPFLSMRYSGDWMFWFQMAMQGDIIEIYENLNYFRLHEKKVTENGKKLGTGIKEDIDVVHYMEQALPHLSEYKRRLCHGLLWHRLKRLHLDEETKGELRALLQEKLDSSIKDRHVLNMNRYLRFVNPWLLTFERDRSKKG